MESNNITNDTEDEFIDYDVNESLSHFEWTELAPVLVVYTLTFCLGLTGNVVIIASTLCPRLRPLPATPTNVFLGGLASADLLLIIFCIPVKIAKLFSYTWTMGLFLCKSVHYMQSVSAICSVLTLTAMSIERYYAIVHPMRAQYTCTISQARKIVIITWIMSFLLAVPIIFTQRHKEVGKRYLAYWCVRDRDSETLWRLHEVYMLLLVLVVPLIVMAFCYTAICWEIWRVMKRRYHMTSRHALNQNNVPAECIPMTQRHGSGRNGARRGRRDDSQTEEESRTMKQVVKMLVAVVVLFAICWSPMLIDNVLTAYGVIPWMKGGAFKHLNTAFQLMAYFNSCINPIVYGFMSKHFRKSFLSAACGSWWCCCPRRGYRTPVKRHPSLSQTRTTSVRIEPRPLLSPMLSDGPDSTCIPGSQRGISRPIINDGDAIDKVLPSGLPTAKRKGDNDSSSNNNNNNENKNKMNNILRAQLTSMNDSCNSVVLFQRENSPHIENNF